MPAIYISYRKDDTPGPAGHLFKILNEAFGAGPVFMDVTRSEPGRDVRQVVDEHVARCDVMLVLIGPEWASARDASGQRRLDSVQDIVHIETLAALSRDMPVIPLLVQGADMVRPEDLPAPLADLAFRNPVTLSQAHWGTDVDALVALLQSLAKSLGQSQAEDTSPELAGPATDEARPRPRNGTSAGLAARHRDARGGPPWRLGLAALALVAGLAYGLYALVMQAPPPLDAAVAEARETAEKALARAEAAQAQAEAAQALLRKGAPQTEPLAVTEPPAPAKPAARAAAGASAEMASAGSAGSIVVAAAAVAPSGTMARPASSAAPATPATPSTPATRAALSTPAGSATPALVATPAPTASPAIAAPSASTVRAMPAPSGAPAAAAPALAEPARAPPPSANDNAARSLTLSPWSLESGACGAGPITVRGTARFFVEKTSEGIVVSEEFRGEGEGVEVTVTGRAVFEREQPSYDIPTTGEWTGKRSFRSEGIDRLTMGDGAVPRSANVVKLRSLCG